MGFSSGLGVWAALKLAKPINQHAASREEKRDNKVCMGAFPMMADDQDNILISSSNAEANPTCDLLNFKPLFADGLIAAQLFRCAFKHDFAVPHDVKALGNAERDGEFLFYQ